MKAIPKYMQEAHHRLVINSASAVLATFQTLRNMAKIKHRGVISKHEINRPVNDGFPAALNLSPEAKAALIALDTKKGNLK